jgi:hypothetical protein
MSDQIKFAFLWLITPIQKWLQRIGRQESLINSDQVGLIKSMIQPGDILLSYEKGRPTSLLIKGFYDHAAILSHQMTVIEAVGDKFIDGKNSIQESLICPERYQFMVPCLEFPS